MEGEETPFGGVSSPSKPPSSPRTLRQSFRSILRRRVHPRGCGKRCVGGVGDAGMRGMRGMRWRELLKKFPPNLPQNFQRIYGESANIVPLAFGNLRYDALHECRDSACWRPFGVRLRGNGRVLYSPLHGYAAPLRMTQWADCCVSGTI